MFILARHQYAIRGGERDGTGHAASAAMAAELARSASLKLTTFGTAR